MDVLGLAGILTDIRSLILLAASLLCSVGIVHYYFGQIWYNEGRRPTGRSAWGGLLLAAVIAVLICLLLLVHPLLLYAPIVLFFFIFGGDKKRDNKC